MQLYKIWKCLYRLEVLKPDWTDLLKKHEQKLYRELSQEEYEELSQEFAVYYREKEYEYEQLLMYFIFTYFCGAVYDRDAFSKVKLAVVSTLLIRELDLAVWLEQDKQFAFEDQIEVAHRYAREVEHSDPNMEAMETMMAGEEFFKQEHLLDAALGLVI